MLSKFNFQIVYRSGKQNEKTDALIRKSDDRPVTDNDDREFRQHQIILTSKKLHSKLFETLSINCLEKKNEILEEYVVRMNETSEEEIRIRKTLIDKKNRLNG